MNFQEKLATTSAEVRARAAQGIARLQASIEVLGGASRQLESVARRHGSRFVKQNSSLAVAVGQDLSRIVRSTYGSLAGRPATGKTRRARTVRRRPASA